MRSTRTKVHAATVQQESRAGDEDSCGLDRPARSRRWITRSAIRANGSNRDQDDEAQPLTGSANEDPQALRNAGGEEIPASSRKMRNR
jgi:hypothetical protein